MLAILNRLERLVRHQPCHFDFQRRVGVGVLLADEQILAVALFRRRPGLLGSDPFQVVLFDGQRLYVIAVDWLERDGLFDLAVGRRELADVGLFSFLFCIYWKRVF